VLASPAVRLVPVLVAAALGVAACGGGGEPDAVSPGSPSGSASASPAPSAVSSSGSAAPSAGAPTADTRRPAAAAGGACRLLTFATVERTLGTDFDVAAASGKAGATQTCVLQEVGATAPDVVLTVTPADGVTAETYRESYVPSGGAALGGVGEAGYRKIVTKGTAGGPRVEIGWLSGSGRVLTLAYTMARQDDPNHTGQVVERLVALGKQVDRTR
jgi:hypothetical protein